VWLDDQKLGAADEAVLVPYGDAPVQLTITAAGRPPRTVRVTPNAPAELTLPAERPRVPAKRTSLSRDLENPF